MLESAPFAKTENLTVNFAYHMFGSAMGSLVLEGRRAHGASGRRLASSKAAQCDDYGDALKDKGNCLDVSTGRTSYKYCADCDCCVYGDCTKNAGLCPGGSSPTPSYQRRRRRRVRTPFPTRYPTSFPTRSPTRSPTPRTAYPTRYPTAFPVRLSSLFAHALCHIAHKFAPAENAFSHRSFAPTFVTRDVVADQVPYARTDKISYTLSDAVPDKLPNATNTYPQQRRWCRADDNRTIRPGSQHERATLFLRAECGRARRGSVPRGCEGQGGDVWRLRARWHTARAVGCAALPALWRRVHYNAAALCHRARPITMADFVWQHALLFGAVKRCSTTRRGLDA